MVDREKNGMNLDCSCGGVGGSLGVSTRAYVARIIIVKLVLLKLQMTV